MHLIHLVLSSIRDKPEVYHDYAHHNSSVLFTELEFVTIIEFLHYRLSLSATSLSISANSPKFVGVSQPTFQSFASSSEWARLDKDKPFEYEPIEIDDRR